MDPSSGLPVPDRQRRRPAGNEETSPWPALEGVSRRGFLGAAGAGAALGLAVGSAQAQTEAALTKEAKGKSAAHAPGAELQAEFDEYGFVVVKELIPRDDAFRLERRVREIMERQADADKIDQHLSGLFNHLDPRDDALFLPLLTQQVCIDLAGAALGEGFQMTEIGCRVRKPGAPKGPIRVTRPIDSFARAGLPMPNVCFVLAFSWMLNDLTRDMGATLYLPFSHHARRGPRTGVDYQHLVAVEAPAGSVLIHHGALWHGFGANTTKDKSRVGVMSGYFPAWMDPVSVGWRPMKRSVRHRMPDAVQVMNRHVVED